MATTTDLKVTPMSEALGAEISGLDLRENLPQDVIDEILRLWQEHIVLIFRDQELSMEQQLAFASRFGELGERKRAPEGLRERTEGIYQTNENILLVTNIKVDGQPIGAFGDADMWFHIDSGYAEKPYKYTFLYGLELPSKGGNTLFANTYKVYDALPDELKAKLAGRKALHIHEYLRTEKVDVTKDISNSPHYYHPVCITHPETGRKAVFVDRLMTRLIEGMEPDESERILNQLFDLIENPEFVYEHVWRLKDVVMWDNRVAVHGRTWFPKEENRLLRRCTVEGEPLYE
ncbi:MAG: TauD/TfdA family dioxygenase [Alphaproteobacteria bacterium]|nr:TauD/TfdA family dioxygenase [Alphaproteobacteria bacterium]